MKILNSMTIISGWLFIAFALLRTVLFVLDGEPFNVYSWPAFAAVYAMMLSIELSKGE